MELYWDANSVVTGVYDYTIRHLWVHHALWLDYAELVVVIIIITIRKLSLLLSCKYTELL